MAESIQYNKSLFALFWCDELTYVSSKFPGASFMKYLRFNLRFCDTE